MPPAYRVEALNRQHERGAFDCGSEPLNRYLREQARQEAEKFVAAPFVLVEEGARDVLGYYTLSASGISAADIQPALAKKLPRHKLLPVTLIGRLAVDQKLQGRGRGAFLLMNALTRIAHHAEQVAAMAVVVDAKDEAVAAFYAGQDFLPLQGQPLRLHLPMRTVLDLVRPT